MIRRGMLILVALFALQGVSARAQQPEGYLAQGWASCQELKDICSGTTPEDVYGGADITHPLGSSLGTCYVHDERACPDCACWEYVKTSYKENPKGYDGGTGCIGYRSSTDKAAARAAAAKKLQELCVSGACCCPVVVPQPCFQGNPVKARDPITGSCCTFPNLCSKPTDWEAVANNDPRCG